MDLGDNDKRLSLGTGTHFLYVRPVPLNPLIIKGKIIRMAPWSVKFIRLGLTHEPLNAYSLVK